VTRLYDLELDKVIAKIQELEAKRVLIQLPDGMRPFAVQLVNGINGVTGAQVFLSGNSCYGACDISIDQARGLGVDLVVHYGHTQYVGDFEIPILYLRASIDIDLRDNRVQLLLESAAVELPSTLSFSLLHPTQDGYDQVLILQHGGDGVYAGVIDELARGNWYLQLEADDWRLSGSMRIPQTETTLLVPLAGNG
jgi:hypothetical protein